MMSRQCTTLFFLFQGLCVYCKVHVRKSEVKSVSISECLSLSDINIQFTNATVSGTRTVAECETFLKACYLAELTLGKYYAVSYTGEGARFSIFIDTEETRGTYTCCEAYNSENCVIMDFKTLIMVDSKNTSYPDEHEETADLQATSSDKADTRILIVLNTIVAIVVIALVAVLCIVFIVRKRMRPCSKKVLEEDLDDEQIHMMVEDFRMSLQSMQTMRQTRSRSVNMDELNANNAHHKAPVEEPTNYCSLDSARDDEPNLPLTSKEESPPPYSGRVLIRADALQTIEEFH